jgi:sporulation protein YlmC with PRC-barrel domain
MVETISTAKSPTRVSAILNNKALLDKLKVRLRNFDVQTRTGESIGDVEDVVLDPDSGKYLNLVVAQPQQERDLPELFVSAKYISKIDGQRRSLTINLDREQIEELPAYYSPIDLRNIRESVSTASSAEVMSESNLSSDISLDDISPEHDPSLFQLGPEQPEMLVNGAGRNQSKQNLDRKTLDNLQATTSKDVAFLSNWPDQFCPNNSNNLFSDDPFSQPLIVSAKFISLKTVAQVLDVIDRTVHYPCHQAKLILTLKGTESQKTYHEFPSLHSAVIVLEAIAQFLDRLCQDIQVELTLDTPKAQGIYQKWFDRYSKF